MEALACGTPVIAFPAGALREIVEHGRTGFLVNDVYEMAEAIRQVDSIDPEECRRAARERFSADRMLQAYLSRYNSLASSSLTQETFQARPWAKHGRAARGAILRGTSCCCLS
jgi:glycosyltransferase involved in cell wall biosynthesis